MSNVTRDVLNFLFLGLVMVGTITLIVQVADYAAKKNPPHVCFRPKPGEAPSCSK